MDVLKVVSDADKKWLSDLSVCDCGVVGALDPALCEALVALKMRMGERPEIRRCFVCSKCLHRFEGYGDSGHDKGTDVDVLVVGQYFRHRMLLHVAYLFPVISINGQTFHLSVRQDWPQKVAFIA